MTIRPVGRPHPYRRSEVFVSMSNDRAADSPTITPVVGVNLEGGVANTV